MSRSAGRSVLTLLLALQGSLAAACGFCIEDKVAAVYDHEVVMAALESRHHVAFFAIDGPLVAGVSTQRALLALVEATHGVDKGSARVSVESASLSFGFDPRRVPLANVLKSMDASLQAKRLSLLPLQVMDRTMTGKRSGK